MPERTVTTTTTNGNNRNQVRALIRGLSVLEILAREGEVGVVDVARELGLGPSTAHRLLATLVDVDYVGQNAASGRYHLGPKLLALAARDELHLDQLRRTMRPHLEKLRAETDETVNLVVPAGTSVVYVDQAQSTQSVRMFTAIGRMVPMHATAAGKAMMAFWAAEDERFWEARPLEAVTDTTIVEPAKIRSELASIKRRGYAVENGEFEDGVSCVAAPVFGADGAVRAAISVAAPSVRLKRFEISALGKMVRAHADRGSHDMGAPQPLGRGQQGS